MNIIEQIKAEIERQIADLQHKEDRAWDSMDGYGDEDAMWYQGGRSSLVRLLSFLSTLEEPKSARQRLADWGKTPEGRESYEKVAEEMRKEKSEKPMNQDGLEEEYKNYVADDPVYSKLVNSIAGLNIARHFARWGAEHRGSPELPKDLNEAADESWQNGPDKGIYDAYSLFHKDGFIAGAKWQKEQMMKEAVEGIVTTRSMAGNIVTAHVDYRYKDGQKVRIIIVKEEENGQSD